jgi:hypothetical protein
MLVLRSATKAARIKFYAWIKVRATAFSSNSDAPALSKPSRFVSLVPSISRRRIAAVEETGTLLVARYEGG